MNPSICIDVNEDGSIHKIKAGNKDAKKIVNLDLLIYRFTFDISFF